MKNVKLIILWCLLSHTALKAQEHQPCTACNKYYYWTGELNNDFFNEGNWRVAVQLPSPPNSQRDNNAVKPTCLPGSNKKHHQICLVDSDLRKDPHPQSGAIDPNTPVNFNLYAKDASISAAGNILFNSDEIGMTLQGVEFTINGSISHGIITMEKRSTVDFYHPEPLGNAAVLNFTDAESWVYLREENPEKVVASSSRFWFNDEPGIIDEDIRVHQYYFKGTLLRAKSISYQPLTIYSSESLNGVSIGLSESIIYAGDAMLGPMNNNIGSFLLKRGYMATLAINDNGTGKSKVYIASEHDLIVNELPEAMKGGVSFIRVLPWNWVTKKGNGGYKPGVNAAWFYNWNNNQTSKENYEYVPMTWGASAALPNTLNQIISKEKVTHLLGFNESDNCSDQSGQYANLCNVDVAVAYYENLMGTGLRLGTPAPRENGPTGWLREFARVAKERDVRFDFVAVHWYDWASNPANSPFEDAEKIFSRFKSYLSNVYNIYGLPIWITEFNANPNRDNAVHAEFLALALPYLEQLDYVERYAYFEPMTANASTNVRPSPLFNTDGEITNIGMIYRDQNSTPSIPEPTYVGNNNLGGMNQPYTEAISEIMMIEAECAMFKGNRWEVKQDSLASGHYFLRHNTNSDGFSPLADQFHYEFESSKTEVYRLWVRMKSNPGINGALKIKMDDRSFESITGLTSSAFTWLRVPRYFSVGPGKHRLSFAHVNDGTFIDRIVLTNTSNSIDLSINPITTACEEAVSSWGLSTGDSTYWLEAESALAGEEWKLGYDDLSVGGKFMEPSNGVNAGETPPGASGYLTFNFTIASNDEYNLWGKVQTLTENSDGFWFSVDGEPFRKWDGLQNKAYQWYWQKLYFSEGNQIRNFTYFLAQGDHTLVVAYSEAGAKIDRIAIARTQRDPSLDDANVLLKDPIMEFEAEDATLLGNPIIVNCTVASNEKLVNLSGSINNTIQFRNIEITNAGSYRLTISYISKNSRNFKLIVNGVDLGAPSNYSVIPSGNWCFEDKPTVASWNQVVTLEAGINSIDIKTISINGNTNAPFIDKISLLKEIRSYEAEEASLIGAQIENCDRASNSQLVKLSISNSNTISFDNVSVDESTFYFVDFHYVTKNARTAKIIVNGIVETVSFEASGNWCFENGPSNAPKVKSLLRELKAGTNRIEIKTTETEAPFIDKITIAKPSDKTPSNRAKVYDKEVSNDETNLTTTNIFPNPAKSNEKLNVFISGDYGSNFELELFDLNGKPVHQAIQGTTNQTFTIEPRLTPGFYIMVVNQPANRRVHKLIIK